MPPAHVPLFPLPLPCVEAQARSGLSRGVRQRVGRRRARDSVAFEATRALNLAANGNDKSVQVGDMNSGTPSSAQSDAEYAQPGMSISLVFSYNSEEEHLTTTTFLSVA